jgi:hypothetical protein
LSKALVKRVFLYITIFDRHSFGARCEDINDRLSDNPYIDASDVEVSMSNGEVILSGKVTDRRDKRRAEDIAEGVSGVRNVENRIRVQSEIGGGVARNP